MRLFPRTARRRLVAATAASTLAVSALVTPLAFAGDGKHLEQRQHHAHSQVRHAQKDLDESSSELRSAHAALQRAHAALRGARSQLEVANARLAAAELRDQQMQSRLDAAQQHLEDAQQALSQGRGQLADQRVQLTDTITDIYEQGDPQLLAFASLLRAQTPADLTRQMEARNAIVGRQSRAYADLHAAEVLLRVRERQVQDARDEVRVERKAAAQHLVAMEQLRGSAAAAKKRVRSLVSSRALARSDARTARIRDLRALKQARRQEQRIRQLILARARHAKGGYHGPTHGLFIRPVPGYVTSSFGYRVHPIYHYWGLHDGTDFGVSCGEGMRAVAGGTVIARYYSAVYGNRLYVSLGQINGKNMTAVYNHATGYRVGVGQHVRQGDVVGYVGSTGWSTGCHLHFSLLVNGRAADPMKWLP